MKTVDACGLTCPAPVLLVKDTVEKEALKELVVLVDNKAACENVTRFLTNKGYSVNPVTNENPIRVEANLSGEFAESTSSPSADSDQQDVKKNVVLIMSDCMGQGADELGRKLMINYIKTLKEMGDELWQIIFVNSGVKMTINSSPVIEDLKKYEEAGVTILACGTCLDFYELLDEKAAGKTTNMLDIVTATQLADKVITMS